MADERPDLEKLGWPKCDRCGQIARLVGLEPDDVDPRASLHTCDCGERIVIQADADVRPP
jgi:hypothetical protein